MNAGHLRFARACSYIPATNDLAYWTNKLKEAERELEAATTRSEINAAAGRLMRVKGELKALERKSATRRGSGVAAQTASS